MLTWFLFISQQKNKEYSPVSSLLVSPSFDLGRLVYRSMVMKQNSVHLVNGPPIELMTRPSAKPFPSSPNLDYGTWTLSGTFT